MRIKQNINNNSKKKKQLKQPQHRNNSNNNLLDDSTPANFVTVGQKQSINSLTIHAKQQQYPQQQQQQLQRQQIPGQRTEQPSCFQCNK